MCVASEATSGRRKTSGVGEGKVLVYLELERVVHPLIGEYHSSAAALVKILGSY